MPVHPCNSSCHYYAKYWRVGRKVGRTIYAQLGEDPSYDDPLIGMMDTKVLAQIAVAAHNTWIQTEYDGKSELLMADGHEA